ncbi:MAG: DnaD domain protein [Clostridia bacterium]|nr:DnaD domain protein [Clostridia bacterium]
MDYFVNPACFSAAFAVPVDVADKYLKLAKGEHIKVLLFMLRNTAAAFSEIEIRENLGLTEYDVREALLFWADAGILMSKNHNNSPESDKKVYKKIIKPTREDVIMRGSEDPKIKWLLNQAQVIFGRNLKFSETQTLVWLYDDLGLDIDLLFLIINHAKNVDKLKISYIQSLAVEWLEKGIDTVAAADEELKSLAENDLAWSVVRSAFGLPPRKPTKKEKELSALWVNEWQMSKEMLTAAYDICVDAKGSVIFSYIAKILEDWHKNGNKATENVKKEQKHGAAYDLDLFEKMINSKE